MTPAGGLGHLWIVGTGRLGPALGAEIFRAGGAQRLTFLGRSAQTPSIPLLADGEVAYAPIGAAASLAAPDAVLIAVPDGAIRGVAVSLASFRLSPAVVLHTSGALSAGELAPLQDEGWRTGSLHPLVAIPDPVRSAGKLRGAWFGIEGDAQALAAARIILSFLGGRELLLTAEQKALYHAAAVMASNHIVALLHVATSMLERCGLDPDAAASALGRLAEGAAADVAGIGSQRALTGPLIRGDIGTLRLHLDQLSRGEARLYSMLAREALQIASNRGLPAETAVAIEDILGEADR